MESAESSDDGEEQRERYRELLEELRTVIPGVQVLFAFLLTVPFSSRFPMLDPLGVNVFAVALVTVGLATVTLLTPAAYHRLTPRHARQQRIKLGVRVTLAGMALLAVAIASSVFVVGRLVFETELEAGGQQEASSIATELGIAAAGLVAGAAVALWFVVPLLRRNHIRDE